MADKNQNQNDSGDKRGFASMDEDKQREIAKKGGQSVPDEKRSFSQDPELASEAGRKGGQESGGNFKNDPERASEAGREGGQSRGRDR
jgi:general stress protein YciG